MPLAANARAEAAASRSRTRQSMIPRKPASVLPLPVGDESSTERPSSMDGTLRRWASVKPPRNFRRNQRATVGCSRASSAASAVVAEDCSGGGAVGGGTTGAVDALDPTGSTGAAASLAGRRLDGAGFSGGVRAAACSLFFRARPASTRRALTPPARRFPRCGCGWRRQWSRRTLCRHRFCRSWRL